MPPEKINLALDHWHIEISSKCALKCPRCPRAEVPESLLNKQLTLDFFKNNVGEEVAKQIKKITFCGNDGDPIYSSDLIDTIKWFKSCNPDISIVIITNGSHKKTCWWHELALTLGKNDEIHWSIDGYDHPSNIQYRVGSEWESIMEGIDAFMYANDTTYTVWAAIAFKFNEDHIGRMHHYADYMGFDMFQLTKSTKFGSKYETYPQDDPLEPSEKFVSSSHRYERQLYKLSDKVRPGEELKDLFYFRTNLIRGLGAEPGICLIGNKGLFLNSRGELYPCCWVASRYEHNEGWTRNPLNLYNNSIDELDTWYEDLLFTSAECKSKCTVEKLEDKNHTLEW